MIGYSIRLRLTLWYSVVLLLGMTLLGDVAKICLREAAGPIDRPGDIVHGIVRQPDKKEARPLLGELERDGFTDASTGASDDGGLS